MPVSIVNPRFRSDPIDAHSFAVLKGGYVQGWFTECSGITIERDVLAYKEGGVNHFEHQLPGGIRRANITLKHGLAGAELWDWFQTGQMTGQAERHHLLIVIYNAALFPISWWYLPDAYPVKWSGPGLKADGQEATVEEVELAYGGNGARHSSIQRSLSSTTEAHLNATEPDEAVPDVDLSALANKVYALLKRDLQIERERLGHRR